MEDVSVQHIKSFYNMIQMMNQLTWKQDHYFLIHMSHCFSFNLQLWCQCRCDSISYYFLRNWTINQSLIKITIGWFYEQWSSYQFVLLVQSSSRSYSTGRDSSTVSDTTPPLCVYQWGHVCEHGMYSSVLFVNDVAEEYVGEDYVLSHILVSALR